MTNNVYLLDTHTLIWFQKNNPLLPGKVLEIIANPDNIILFSQISLFELAIKQRIGKMPEFLVSTNDVYKQALNDNFVFMSIQNQHIYRYSHISLFENHRDPFDRLLIATAFEEKATILSGDEKFGLYKDIVNVSW